MPYPEGESRQEQMRELLQTSPEELKRLAVSFIVQGDEWMAKEGGGSGIAAECYAKSAAFSGLAVLAHMRQPSHGEGTSPISAAQFAQMDDSDGITRAPGS